MYWKPCHYLVGDHLLRSLPNPPENPASDHEHPLSEAHFHLAGQALTGEQTGSETDAAGRDVGKTEGPKNANTVLWLVFRGRSESRMCDDMFSDGVAPHFADEGHVPYIYLLD